MYWRKRAGRQGTEYNEMECRNREEWRCSAMAIHFKGVIVKGQGIGDIYR